MKKGINVYVRGPWLLILPYLVGRWALTGLGIYYLVYGRR